MSATDRIREAITQTAKRSHSRSRPITVTAWEAEALCDLADTARKAVNCERCSPVEQLALNDVDRALARLDREEAG